MSSKTIPPDLQEFLSEAQEIVERLGADLLSLEKTGTSDFVDPDVLNSVFRQAHSLKGLAGMFGLEHMSNLAHNMENVLDALRLGRISLGPSVLDLLFEGLEILGKMLSDIEAGTGDEVRHDRLTEYISRLKTMVDGEKRGEIRLEDSGLDSRILDVLTEYEEHRLKENLRLGRNLYVINAEFDLMSFDQRLTDLNQRLKKEGEIISTLPSATPGDENSIKFDLLYGSQLSLEEVSEIASGDGVSVSRAAPATGTDGAGQVVEKLKSGHAKGPETRRQGKTSDETGGRAESVPAAGVTGTKVPKGVGHTVRVDIRKLDQLMEVVGELVLSQLALKKIYFDLEMGADLRASLMALHTEQRQLERKIRTLRESILSIRMVPLGPTFDKVARIVRRICRENGKEINLEVTGGDTELDKMIVEEVGDPLVHLIRNSLDHGIESPEARVRAGKDELGTIRLSAKQQGSHVVIEVGDDGAGIDMDAVKTAAVAKGLVPAERAGELDEQAVLDLLFVPGMTTRSEVGELSGRGVGLDVVKENISKLAGVVEVETESGAGTTFRLTLPMTLAIVRAMLLSVSGRTFALPLTSIRESIAVDPGTLDNIGGLDVLDYRGNTVPVLRLSEHFRLPGRGYASVETRSWMDEGLVSYVVIVGLAERKLGLLVDRLIGEQDLVVKPLGPVFKRLKRFAGAAELADKSTVLVLDAGGLIEEAFSGGGGNV